MGWELGEPRALWALALALPVVATHLYRKRRRRIAVAFVPLLREAVGPTRSFGWWRRLADVARLACRVLAVACLALALAAPRPARAATPPVDLMVIVDADASTAAVEARLESGGVETRFEREVALARAHVRAHVGGRVGAIRAGRVPTVLAAPSDDREAVLTALDGAPRVPDGGRGDLGAALRLAAGAASPGRALRTLLISSRELPEGVGKDVLVLGAGEASDDQGITDLVLTAPDENARVALRLALRNASDAPRSRRVELRLRHGAAALESREVSIPARGRTEARFELTAPRGGGLVEATLLGDDALPGNDVVAVWLEPPTRPSVLVVSEGGPRPFVTAVLEAMGGGIDREASGVVAPADLARAAPRDVTIVDGAAAVPAALSPGGWIFLAPFAAGADAGRPFATGRQVLEPVVWRADLGHPLLRGTDLSTAFVARATTVSGPGATGLAFVEGEAVVAEGESRGARWLAFGLDPDGSDLPVRAALPVLLKNAIRRLGAAPQSPMKAFHRADEPMEPRAPWPAGPVTVTFEGVGKAFGGTGAAGTRVPGGPAPGAFAEPASRSRVLAAGSPALLAPRGGPWLATFEPSGAPPAHTAVADLDPALDVRPARPAAKAPPPAGPSPEDDASLWLRWLLLAAAGFLGVDLALGAAGAGKVATPSRAS